MSELYVALASVLYILMVYSRYAEYCGLDAPSDDIDVVLESFSKRIGALLKGKWGFMWEGMSLHRPSNNKNQSCTCVTPSLPPFQVELTTISVQLSIF